MINEGDLVVFAHLRRKAEEWLSMSPDYSRSDQVLRLNKDL